MQTACFFLMNSNDIISKVWARVCLQINIGGCSGVAIDKRKSVGKLAMTLPETSLNKFKTRNSSLEFVQLPQDQRS